MKQLTERQKQSIQTKLKITKISMDLFKRKGFENVKIQEICEEAEMSIGAFYHHFKSKSDIINIGYEQVDLLVKERLESKTYPSTMSKISALLSEGCDILSDLGWIFVSDVYKNLLQSDSKYTLAPDRFVSLEIKSSIELAQREGHIKNTISSDELTKILLRISRGAIFDWCLNEGKEDLKEKMLFDLNLVLSNYIQR